MKNAMMVAALSLISLSAFAQNTSNWINTMGEGNGGDNEIECSDPRTLGRYDTRHEAELGCPKFDNIDVGYDVGYGQYICACEAPNHGGGGGN